MSQQFHTPSFGDEMFEISDTTATDQNVCDINSKRMRNLDQSSPMDEYHDTTNTTTDNVVYPAATPNTLSNPVISLTSATAQSLSTPTPSSQAAHQEALQMPKKQTAVVLPLSHSQQTLPTVNGTYSSTAIGEPAKPISAYTLFFRDSMNAIKEQNPSCTFQEISVVVSKMWETLDEQQKNIYNERHELAKRDYITASQLYRQQLEEQQQQLQQQRQESTEPQPNAPVQATAEPSINKSNITNVSAATSTTAAPSSKPINEGVNNTTTDSNTTQAPQQIQLLTEAAATQKCTRENCNKPAIINPDWEDEYCSNECVIIHCRTVFSDWVKSMTNPQSATESTTVSSSSADQEAST